MKADKSIKNKTLKVLIVISGLSVIFRLWIIAALGIIGFTVLFLVTIFRQTKCKKKADTECGCNDAENVPPDIYFTTLIKSITESVLSEYPEAEWVWEKSNGPQLLKGGKDAYIILNKAGGYKKAKVVMSDCRFERLEFVTCKEVKTETEISQNEEIQADNFELLAYEWVESHVMELNERINEAIGQGNTEMLINSDELPTKESYPDVCKELKREGIKEMEIVPEGIKIYVPRFGEYQEES